MPIMITDLLGDKCHRPLYWGDFTVERRFLSGGAGDLYRQYYGADAEDDRYRLVVLERQRQRRARFGAHASDL